jgi:hypothetical protein
MLLAPLKFAGQPENTSFTEAYIRGMTDQELETLTEK